MLKIKIERKRKLDSFLFQGENNSKTFKNYWVIRAESPPLMNPVTIELLNQCDENLADSLMGVQEDSNTNETL